MGLSERRRQKRNEKKKKLKKLKRSRHEECNDPSCVKCKNRAIEFAIAARKRRIIKFVPAGQMGSSKGAEEEYKKPNTVQFKREKKEDEVEDEEGKRIKAVPYAFMDYSVKSFGMNYMFSYKWEVGNGLGLHANGMQLPLEAVEWPRRAGIGSVPFETESTRKLLDDAASNKKESDKDK